jgi:multidrug efflux pump subunit AcrA (membrane-fusion protein)
VVADGKAKKVPVRIGFRDAANVEILDGLRPDQLVIVSLPQGINDGQPLVVTETK